MNAFCAAHVEMINDLWEVKCHDFMAQKEYLNSTIEKKS